MARCLRCGATLPPTYLDVYGARPCLELVRHALAELLVWSASSVWRTSDYWWRVYEEGAMDDDQMLQQAIAQVRASGEEVTATRVRKALMALGHGEVSYQEVYQQLMALGVLTDDAGA